MTIKQKNEFTQHIPNFCEGFTPKIYRFDSIEDLLAQPLFDNKSSDFSHYALSGNKLMEISNAGFNWWVMGYIKDISNIILPEFKAKYFALIDGKEEVLTDEQVEYLCGDELGLKDGRKAERVRKK